jgi:hypothetical protein
MDSTRESHDFEDLSLGTLPATSHVLSRVKVDFSNNFPALLSARNIW